MIRTENDRGRLRALAEIEQSQVWKTLRPIIQGAHDENTRLMARVVDPAMIHRHQGMFTAFESILGMVDGATQRLNKLNAKGG